MRTGRLVQVLMTRELAHLVLLGLTCASCADVAGLDDIVTRSETGPAAVDTGTAPEASTCVAAQAAPPTCGAGMVPVPGGCFTPRGESETVVVEPFCVDVTEVTFGAYLSCAQMGACPMAERTVSRTVSMSDADFASYNRGCNANKAAHDEHPMNCVDSVAATAFCGVRSARLLTNVEWEWIAHGGPADSIYPWGNQTVADRPCFDLAGTCVVGSRKDVGVLGIHDLGGNVGEWTSTPSADDTLVIRGGWWSSTLATEVAQRTSAPRTSRLNTVGFRCAR